MKKYISLFLFFAINTHSALTLFENFSSDVVGEDATQGDWFESGHVNPTSNQEFNVVSSTGYSGNGFRLRQGGVSGVSDSWSGGIWNITVEDDIKSFEFKWKASTQGTASTPTTSMIFLDSDFNEILNIRFVQGNGAQTTTTDISLSNFYVVQGSDWSTWLTVRFVSNAVGNLVSYSLINSTGVTLKSADISTSAYFTDLSHINFTGTTTNTHTYMYVDDVLINGIIIPDFECNDFSEYEFTGNNFLDADFVSIKDCSSVEFGGFYQINATFHGIELLVDSQQYNIDNDIENYFAYFNGNYVGMATCFYPYGSNYILQFAFEEEIEVGDEKLVIELYHYYPEGSKAWYLLTENYDVVGPPMYSQGYFYNVNTSNINGVLDGDFVTHIPKWRAYYTNLSSGGENPNYENAIILSGFDTSHPIYDVPFTCMYNTVFFINFVDQTSTPYTLHVFREGVEVGQAQNFPRYLNNYKETIGFTPLNTGNYTVTMNTTTDELVNHSFYVENCSVNYAIWTSPNPSNSNSDYKVFTYIKDTSLFDMYQIGFFSSVQPTNNIMNAFDYVQLDTTSHFDAFEFSHNNAHGGKHLLRIFGNVTPLLFSPLGSTYTHYINSGIGKEEYISVSEQYPNIDEEFNIYGYHSYIETDARVRLGAIEIQDVTGDNNFLFPYTISKTGTYVLTLEVLLDGTWLTLDAITVYVSEGGDASSEDTWGQIFGSIPVWIKGLLGAIITICFVFMPFIMVQYLEKLKFKVDIPPVAYAMSGGIGVTLSTILGFFDFSIMFFICVIAGISLVISYVWAERSD